jgi:hypothetical protein
MENEKQLYSYMSCRNGGNCIIYEACYLGGVFCLHKTYD